MSWTTKDEMAFLFGDGSRIPGLVNMAPDRIRACRFLAGKQGTGIAEIMREYLANLRTRRWTGCSVDIDEVEEAVLAWLNRPTFGRRADRERMLRDKGVIR